jgi:hypothetical protein
MAFTPHDAGTHAITRAQALLTTAGQGGLPPGVATDLRRLSVVMAVAALDTYMHRLVVSRAYENETMPGGLASLTVTFGDLVQQADDAVDARRAGRNTRPRVAAKRVLRNRLLRETFQRSENVSKALSMAGLTKAWDQIAAQMPPAQAAWTAQTIRGRLDSIVDRRNAMVHEGDYDRLDRPQTATLVNITAAEATAAVDFMGNLIDAIHAV